ncbi:hypothetical protein K9M42_02830 [Patescibacteria group bacterium]|nr:hypothetical protein [Patescibacteria group bacterium]
MSEKSEKGIFLSEQKSDEINKKVKIKIKNTYGQLWIKSEQFKNLKVDKDWEIGLEIWDGMLRLLIYENITVEDPRIINLGKVENK